jgi:hypothetical protein
MKNTLRIAAAHGYLVPARNAGVESLRALEAAMAAAETYYMDECGGHRQFRAEVGAAAAEALAPHLGFELVPYED